MQAFLIATGLVAIAEIGDKTQLLAFVLASRFRRPWAVVAGILVATLLNHAAATALGSWITAVLSPGTLRWVLALSFAAMALWVLKPDRLEDDGAAARSSWGAFGTTALLFFLAEMGDKTQLATIGLAAHYAQPVAVTAGTTLGMLLANAPVVWLGQAATARLPLLWIRRAAALLFAGMAVLALLWR